MIHLVVDSSAQLTEAEKQDNDITVIPMQVTMNGKVYRDDTDITKQEFAYHLANDDEYPNTSQPAIGDFLKAYHDIFADDPEAKIVSVHLGSKFSGTVNAAKTAAKQLNHEDDIAVVDSGAADRGISFPLLKAAELRKQGKSFAEIEAGARENANHTDGFLCVYNLEYLINGGRANMAMDTKQLHQKDDLIIDNIIANPKVKYVGLPYVDDDKEVSRLAERLHSARPDINLNVNMTCTASMPHAGSKGYAIFYNDDLIPESE